MLNNNTVHCVNFIALITITISLNIIYNTVCDIFRLYISMTPNVNVVYRFKCTNTRTCHTLKN